MTQDEALSALRSNGHSAPGAELVIVRRLEPTPDTRRVAEESLHEIESRHLSRGTKGLLAEFLRAGGFVVLECDRKSDVSTTLHLVTMNQAGAPLVESERIEGVGSRRDAQALIQKGAELSDAVFSSPALSMDEILAGFGGAQAAMLDLPGNAGFFGIPDSVKKFATPGEQSELRSVSALWPLWTLRCALTLQVFAADAGTAFRQAGDELFKLGEESLASAGARKSAKPIDDLFNPESIHTRGELATRVRQLKVLNSLLDNRSPLPLDSTTFRVNASTSTIPLKLYGPAKDTRQLYIVITASGLFSGWERSGNGRWVLRALTMVGD